MKWKSVVFNLQEEFVKVRGEMGTLNQSGQLPVGVKVWYPRCFLCVCRLSFMYVHVGEGAWIFLYSRGCYRVS